MRYEPELVDRRNGLLQAMADADALIVRNRSQVDAALLASAPRLRAVGRLGVGLDNIDLTACARAHRRGAGDGANARAVAEYVIGTLLVLLRGAYGASAAVADGQWPRAALSDGLEAHGRTLGVVGFGGIGRLVATLARGLGMRVVGHDAALPAGHPAWGECGVESCSLDALLERRRGQPAPAADPGHAAPVRRRAHQPHARGRGADQYLARRHRRRARPGRALRAGRLRGAALDVFEAEPLPPAAAGRPAGRHPAGQAERPARPDPHAPYRRTDARSQRPRFRHGGVRCDNSPYRRRPMNDSGAPTDEKDMAHIYLDELQHLAAAGLAAGANPAMADSTARALVFAESQGLSSHGLSRVPFYAGHLRAGRAVGSAVPRIVRERGGAALIDAGSGLAFPACALAVEQAGLRARARRGLHRRRQQPPLRRGRLPPGSHGRPGPGGPGAEQLTRRHARLGRQAAAVRHQSHRRRLSRRGGALVIDLSLSQVARGKLMIAARDNQPIPLGWALDADGNPTTDPKAGLAGSMPAGGVKGAMLALIVELLACALTGSHFGFETESFFVDEGGPARLGQAFMAIDPGALAGNDAYLERVETLVDVMLEDEHVRLPGDRRRKLRDEALKHGVELPEALMAQLRAMAGAS